MATILVIEDEAKMARLLELNLAEAGYATRSAADAESRSFLVEGDLERAAQMNDGSLRGCRA